MIFEGEVTLFTLGFLTRLHFFDVGDMGAIVLAGVLTGDLAWYWLGYKLKNSSTAVVRWGLHLTRPFEKFLSTKPFHLLLVSKYIYGINHLLLARAGMIGLSFKKYLRIELVAEPIWIVIIGGLGYLSGASYGLVRHYVRFIEIILLALVVLFWLISHVVSQNLKQQLIKEQK